jgi:hypothetical protein
VLLAWRNIATVALTKEWKYTVATSASFFRISHTIDSPTLGTLRGAIGQSIEGIVFDRRLMGYKPGLQEGQLFILPNEIESRFLAIQRLDDLATNWNIRIEELINLATTLPLSIDDIENLRNLLNAKAASNHQHQITDVSGLAIALDEKLDTTDLAASEQLLIAQIAQKSPIGHGHVIADTTGLQADLDSKALTNHQHQITDVAGLAIALDEKVETTDLAASEQLILAQVAQKAPIEHNHEIADTDGLQTALDGKALTQHQHQISDVGGLAIALNEKAAISYVDSASAILSTAINQVLKYSEVIPASPKIGDIWVEVTSSGIPIETWIYAVSPSGNKWLSLTTYEKDYFAGSSSISGGVSYQLPIKQGVDFLFLDFQTYCLYSTPTPIDTTANHWRVLWGMVLAGVNVANSQPLPFGDISRQFNLNILFSPQTGERLTCMFNKTGNAPAARLGSTIRYKLVRR